jgi:RNA recognition motif-containing protein
MSAADSLMADASTSAVKAESGADAAVKAEGAAGPASSADAKPAGDASSADDARAANRTLYLTNLNQKVKLDVLKQSLLGLFGTYGEVLSVTAHRNVRMRGQAFVAFKEQDAATKAKAEVAGFPLYGKPMVSGARLKCRERGSGVGRGR